MAVARVIDVPFVVQPIPHSTGERIPALLHADTRLPCRVAMRWVVRYRRYRTQLQTLLSNLRVLAWTYLWALQQDDVGDLDEFLLRGGSLTDRQLLSLGETLRMGAAAWNMALPLPAPSTGDGYLGPAINFLTWAVDPANRGGRGPLSFSEINAECDRISARIDSTRVGGRASERPEPITDEEVALIRTAMGMRLDPGTGFWHLPMENGVLVPPRRVFRKDTWLRNIVMFEVAQELGIRRGEALKLLVASLPRGRDRNLRIQRLPDDPRDSRAYEPAVKTQSRLLPMSPGLIRLINYYVDGSRPIGRPRAAGTPYLFVTDAGKPLSITQADSIMRAIGRYAGVRLSWHPLRHRWAERTAEDLLDDPQGWDKLLYLGGWEDDRTARWYIQRASAKKARQFMAAYQGNLYSAETP